MVLRRRTIPSSFGIALRPFGAIHANLVLSPSGEAVDYANQRLEIFALFLAGASGRQVLADFGPYGPH